MSNQADACRRRAEECELAASKVTDPAIRAGYADVVAQWRRMAEQQQAIDALLAHPIGTHRVSPALSGVSRLAIISSARSSISKELLEPLLLRTGASMGHSIHSLERYRPRGPMSQRSTPTRFGALKARHGTKQISLRSHYGERFAKGCADDESLSEAPHKLDELTPIKRSLRTTVESWRKSVTTAVHRPAEYDASEENPRRGVI